MKNHMIDLELIADRNALRAGQADRAQVLVRVSARADTAAGAERVRAPMNLALVIDRSGSMRGNPLFQAKRCAERMVERLAPRDLVTVVAYDQSVDVVVPTQAVVNRGRILEGIRSIEAAGMTALYDGWHVGATQVAEALVPGHVARVLLLSDGCANQGLTDPATIARHCAMLAENGVSTSTYGLGKDFNEDLMAAMAQAGQGRAHYGQTAEDLMDPFQEEFDLLDALVARRLRLELRAEPGVQFRNLNGYRTNPKGAIILPDLPGEGDVWVLLEVEVAASGTTITGEGLVQLLSARLHYLGDGGAAGQTEPVSLALRPLDAAAHALLEVNDLVMSRSIELHAAQKQQEAREAARHGDWARVEAIIAEIREFAAGHGWILASLDALQAYANEHQVEHFAKEAHYKAASMRSRVVARSEVSGDYALSSEALAPSYLRRKSEQGKRFEDPDT